MTEPSALSGADVDAVVEMALSDDVPFATIKAEYGLGESDVKQLMRETLKASSYRRWRARVRRFSDRREHYK